MMSCRNATREDFEHVIAALKNKLVEPSDYITLRAHSSVYDNDLLHPSYGTRWFWEPIR